MPDAGGEFTQFPVLPHLESRGIIPPIKNRKIAGLAPIFFDFFKKNKSPWGFEQKPSERS